MRKEQFRNTFHELENNNLAVETHRAPQLIKQSVKGNGALKGAYMMHSAIRFNNAGLTPTNQNIMTFLHDLLIFAIGSEDNVRNLHLLVVIGCKTSVVR
jgi:hypothetical protein